MIAGHIDSHYARTANPAPTRPSLDGDVDVDVCVVGGGLAGLNAALGLIERGKSVAVVEARRIAWGASGRNGGFVGSGFSADPDDIIARVGLDQARALYRLSRDAVDLVKQRIRDHKIACTPIFSGSLRAWWTDNADEPRRRRDFLADKLDVAVEFWPRDKLRAQLVSRRYHDGLYYPRTFHFHPLNYALGIADLIERKGGRIFEMSPAVRLETDGARKSVRTASGRVTAEAIAVACGGYIAGLHPGLSRAIQPIATYVMATEPLGERLTQAMRAHYCVTDSRFDFDYYRPLLDTRILWGGGVSVRRRDPRRLRQIMLNKLLAVYPQLAGVRVETAWSGLMGYPRHAMPQVGEIAPGLWYAMGFGGNGMGTTTLAGEMIAGAIADNDDRYKLLAPFGLDPTGGRLGLLALEAWFHWRRLRDRMRR